MSSRIHWIKPCRPRAEMPTLQPEQALALTARGIDVCATLDLSILNRIHEAMTLPVEEHTGELQEDIAALRKILALPFLHVAPGYALDEAREDWVRRLLDSYEAFFASEMPNFVDSPNAIPVDFDRRRSTKYLDLPASEQRFHGFAYLSMLKVQDILDSSPKLSSEGMVDLFLEFMSGVADVIPALETEAMKHCFYRSDATASDPFIVRSRQIQWNFDKGGKGEKRVDRALNAARDLMFIRSAAMKDGKTLDGREQDTWLITRDAGVAAFCATIHFVPTDKERAKHVAVAPDEFRKNDSYWRYADKTTNGLVQQRNENERALTSDEIAKQLNRVAELSRQLHERLSRRTE